MELQFNLFFAQVNGKYIEVEDSSNYAQCMDLAFKWLDFLHIPRDTIRHLYAYQAWTNPFDSTKKYFDLIPNTATNVPVVGDVPIFGQSVGYAGHIAIASPNSNSQNLISLDQNWGNPKTTRLVTHFNYAGVLGWLHPKTFLTGSISKVDLQAIVDGSGSDGDKLNKIRKLLV